MASRSACAGLVINVPVLEAPGAIAIGRFGWKKQHASLLSFSADAYLNEMGITSRAVPRPRTRRTATRWRRSTRCRTPRTPTTTSTSSPRFMRATKAPPRGRSRGDAGRRAGATLFNAIGCNVCHVPHDHDRARRDDDQRRRVHRAGGAGQQDHPSVQRLPAARRRHRRRHRAERRAVHARTSCGRRRCGACARATASCTTAPA